MKVTKVRIEKETMAAIGARYFEKEMSKTICVMKRLPKFLVKPYGKWGEMKLKKMADKMESLGIPERDVCFMMAIGAKNAVMHDFKKTLGIEDP